MDNSVSVHASVKLAGILDGQQGDSSFFNKSQTDTVEMGKEKEGKVSHLETEVFVVCLWPHHLLLYTTSGYWRVASSRSDGSYQIYTDCGCIRASWTKAVVMIRKRIKTSFCGRYAQKRKRKKKTDVMVDSWRVREEEEWLRMIGSTDKPKGISFCRNFHRFAGRPLLVLFRKRRVLERGIFRRMFFISFSFSDLMTSLYWENSTERCYRFPHRSCGRIEKSKAT